MYVSCSIISEKNAFKKLCKGSLRIVNGHGTRLLRCPFCLMLKTNASVCIKLYFPKGYSRLKMDLVWTKLNVAEILWETKYNNRIITRASLQ